MRELLIATTNSGKFREMAPELEEIGLEVRSLEDLGVSLERPESGETYLENARIKADEAHERSSLPTLADDSGIEVDAMDGEPGIHSSRFGGEGADPSDQIRLMLEKLEGLDPDQRTARYVCEMVLVDEQGVRYRARGVCEGRIARAPRGEGGFGYDPIFEVKQADWKTFAELPPRYKEWLSHRSRALNTIISRIREDFFDDTGDNAR